MGEESHVLPDKPDCEATSEQVLRWGVILHPELFQEWDGAHLMGPKIQFLQDQNQKNAPVYPI